MPSNVQRAPGWRCPWPALASSHSKSKPGGRRQTISLRRTSTRRSTVVPSPRRSTRTLGRSVKLKRSVTSNDSSAAESLARLTRCDIRTQTRGTPLCAAERTHGSEKAVEDSSGVHCIIRLQSSEPGYFRRAIFHAVFCRRARFKAPVNLRNNRNRCVQIDCSETGIRISWILETQQCSALCRRPVHRFGPPQRFYDVNENLQEQENPLGRFFLDANN